MTVQVKSRRVSANPGPRPPRTYSGAITPFLKMKQP
jgi:hypothetical protein